MVGYIKSLKIPIFLLCMLVYTPAVLPFFGPVQAQLGKYGARIVTTVAAQKTLITKHKNYISSFFDKECLFKGLLTGCFMLPFVSYPRSKEETRVRKNTKRLFSAVKSNNIPEARALFEKGVNPNLMARQLGLAKQYGDPRSTPAHVAALHCHSQLYGMLIARGADIKKKNKQGQTAEALFAQCPDESGVLL